MRALKIVAGVLFVLLLLVAGALWVLDSSAALDRVLGTVLRKSLPDLRYARLEGDLFHGIALKGIDYQNRLKGDLYLKVDFSALRKRRLVIEEANLSDLWIAEDFVEELLHTPSKKREKESKKPFAPPLEGIDARSINLSLHDFRWRRYEVAHLQLHIGDLHTDLKSDLRGRIQGAIESNVANLRWRGDARWPRYRLDLNGSAKGAFLASYLPHERIVPEGDLPLALHARGDMRQVRVGADLGAFRLRMNDLTLANSATHLDTRYLLASHELNATGRFMIGGDPAKIGGSFTSTMDLDDLNATLKLDAQTHIRPKEAFVRTLLQESNTTLEHAPQIDAHLVGTMRRMHLGVESQPFTIAHSGIPVRMAPIALDTNLSLMKGDLSTYLQTRARSDIATLELLARTRGNLHDLNDSLRYDAAVRLIAKPGEVRYGTKRLQIVRPGAIDLNATGTMHALQAKMRGDLAGRIEGHTLRAHIEDTQAHFKIAHRLLRMASKLQLSGDIATLHGDLNLSVGLRHPKTSLRHEAHLQIEKIMPTPDLNLTQLLPLRLHSGGGARGLFADLSSKRLHLSLKSRTLERFNYELTSGLIDLRALYPALPPKLGPVKIKLHGNGYARPERKAFVLDAKIDKLLLNRRWLHTDPFRAHVQGDRIDLERFALRGKGILWRMQLHKGAQRALLNLHNRAIDARMNARLSPMALDANFSIPSLQRLFVELRKLYPLDLPERIDGPVQLRAHTRKGRIHAELASSKITLPKGGRIEKLRLIATGSGTKERGEVRIEKLGCRLAGFKPKKMNRKIALKREGLISWRGEDAKVDIDFGQMLRFEGVKHADDTEADLLSDNLYLGYAGYGHTSLTTNLHLSQHKERIEASGLILFDDTLITYQPRFLDISEDKDIVIVQRGGAKEKRAASGRFLEDFALDIWVRSKDEMHYKTLDGEIFFTPELRIFKEYGKPQKLTGKIKVQEGYYDFADKRYTIQEGAIAFRGQREINPLLDLHILYDEIEDVKIYIDIGGDARHPKLTFRSKPPMPKKEIFSYLLFGMSTSEVQGAAGNASKAAEKIFSRAVSKDLARELNLDRLDLQRNEEGGFDIRAGKRVNKKSILYYQNKRMQSSFIYERKMGRHWRIDLNAGQTIGKEGTGTTGMGVDLFFKKGFKK